MEATLKVNEAFGNLIQNGRQLLQQYGWNGTKFHQWHPPKDAYAHFCTRALNLIKRSCGDAGEHYKALVRLQKTESNSYYLPQWIGVVEAAHADIQDGLLLDLRSLLEAELLGDFLEQAETLWQAKYHQAAASLAGAVLEDTLRSLCKLHDVPLPRTSTIDATNISLAKASVYNKLKQKQITGWADIRNNADHAKWDEFTREDVRQMLDGVRTFAADYLR